MRNAAPGTETNFARTVQRDGRHLPAKGTPKRGPAAVPSKEFVNANYSYHVFNEASADGIVQTVDAIGAFAREHGPGCYSVDVSFRHPLPGSVNVTRAWGNVIHRPGGKVAIHIHPVFESK